MIPTDSSSPVRYGRLAAVLVLSVLMGFFIGVYFYRHWIYDQRALSGPGLGVNPTESPGTSQPAIVNEQLPGPSSLTMIRTGPMGSEMAGRSTPQSAQTLTTLIRGDEWHYRRLAVEYTRKYPIIREFGRDWASYPDLRRFNQEYDRDHDPIKFSYHVVSSPNFATLVKKYSGRPEILQFIQDIVKTTPVEIFDASRSFLTQDNRAYDLLKQFAHAAGLPDSVAAGLASRSASPQQTVSALKSDPQLKKLLEQGNVNPDQLNQDFKNQR